MNPGDRVRVKPSRTAPAISGKVGTVLAVHPGNAHTPETMLTVHLDGAARPVCLYGWRLAEDRP